MGKFKESVVHGREHQLSRPDESLMAAASESAGLMKMQRQQRRNQTGKREKREKGRDSKFGAWTGAEGLQVAMETPFGTAAGQSLGYDKP